MSKGVVGLKETDNGPNGKTSDETESGVGNGDDHVVEDDWLINWVVRSIGGHDTHADTDGEEDLTTSGSPNTLLSSFITGNIGIILN